MKNCITEAGKKSRPFLQLNGITVRFGGLTALNRVDLRVMEKGITGIIGPNGAGKSTLFNTITGYINPTAGEIEYQGESILGLAPHVIAKKGMIRTFQKSGVFPEMSVLENVMTGYHRLLKVNAFQIALRLKKVKSEETEIMRKALEVLETFGLLDLAERQTGDLSFGQQRLVEISRALVGNPAGLLLDEPAAGLSSSERHQLIELLRGISKEQGIYILLADHSMDFVMNICERIAVLNYGTKIAEDTPERIQENEEVLEAYLGKGESSDAISG